jgi:hypothetical protein
MATLTGKKVKDTYKSLLKLEGDTGSPVAGASGDAVQVKTGDNDATALYLNTDRVGVGVADPDHELEVAGKIHISNEGSAPSAPSAGDGGIIYTKADGKPYWISDDVADVALTNTVAVSADLDYGGYYSLNEQGRQNHVANTMSAPYYRFDGVDDKIIIATNSVVENHFDNGGTISAWIYPLSDGESSAGRVIATDNWNLFLDSDDGTNCKLAQVQVMSGDNPTFTTSALVLPLNTWSHVATVYDNGSGTNYPVMYINGVSYAVERNQAGTGTRTTSAGHGYGIGSDRNGNVTFDGQIAGVTLFNNALTAPEVKELYSGASVPFKYKGANQTELVTDGAFTNTSNWTEQSGWSVTGGSLEIDGASNDTKTYNTVSPNNNTAGKRYRATFTVSNYSAGAVHYEIGANDGTERSANGTYTEEFTLTTSSSDYGFQCTGTTTLDIDDFSVVQIGAVAEYDGSSAGAHQWGDKSGNELHGTVGDGAGGATAPSLENTPYDSGTEYEEGTWTPAWVAATGTLGTINYTNLVGKYTKIGDTVHIKLSFYNGSFADGGASGALSISGLPFTASAGACSLSFGDTRLFAGDTPSEAQVNSSAAIIALFYRDAADGANTNLLVADAATGSGALNLVTISGTYFV